MYPDRSKETNFWKGDKGHFKRFLEVQMQIAEDAGLPEDQWLPKAWLDTYKVPPPLDPLTRDVVAHWPTPEEIERYDLHPDSEINPLMTRPFWDVNMDLEDKGFKTSRAREEEYGKS